MTTDLLPSLRSLFLAPTNTYRHLAIVHELLHEERCAWDYSNRGEIELRSGQVEKIKGWLDTLAQWGFGGIVTNVSWRNYLEDDGEWAVFLTGIRIAKELGFRIWIYDEAGYPSGAAGGIVLRDHPEYEAQALVRMRGEFEAGGVEMRPPSGWLYPVRVEARYPDGAVADITAAVERDGLLRLRSATGLVITRFDARRTYEGTHCTCNVHKKRRYINVLQEEAIDYFYKVTAERYFEQLGEDARLVEAVFTDEPSFMSVYFPELPGDWKVRVPVEDVPQDDFDRIPMITWDKRLPERVPRAVGI